MKSIHVLRKPCSESTVAANVLRWGTGASNIDLTRVAGMAPSVTGQGFRTGRFMGQIGHGETTMSGILWNPAPAGRWPANLVLQHLDGCVQDGVKKVVSGNVKFSGFRTLRENPVYGVPNTTRNAPDNYGTETVAAWTCAEGCPVATLDAQSGVLTSGTWNGHRNSAKTKPGIYAPFVLRDEVGIQGNKGGASRFFKQIGGRSK